MADQNTEKGNMSGCFAVMREMMRNMMSGEGGSCCSCAETMSAMITPGCPDKIEKENPAKDSAPKGKTQSS